MTQIYVRFVQYTKKLTIVV